MKSKLLLCLVAISFLATSCLSLGLKLIGAYEEEATVSEYTNNNKTVAYIPLRHIGLTAFYNDIKFKVDSLQDKGYIVFMESTRVTDTLTELQQDTLRLKVRKILGVALNKGGYLDTVNNKLLGRNFKNKKGLINQPKYHAMGVDTLKGRIADVPLNRLVQEYEKRYGSIPLNDCDYTTPLADKYDCGAVDKGQKNALVLEYRNQNLAQQIVNEKHNKIAVLYGALHERGLYTELKALDSTWFKKVRP